MRTWITCLLAALPLLTGIESKAEESCGTCHPNVQTEYSESIHTKEFGCVGCHGGDPTALGLEAHSAAKAYIGKPDRTAVPAMCATCHADPNRMKSFGLPTDQYAQYLTSGHGLRLAKGDTRVAICTDCHGTHRIVAPKEPTAPTARRNIPATCGRCHSDQALMAAYNLKADQVEKFSRSVHGVALFDEEHPRAPTCATCHGAHGAVAPQVGSIGMVCGHCHSRTREYFKLSPHWKATEEGKMSECVSCHGYHDTVTPDRMLFDTACQGCHPVDSAPFALGQKLKTLLSRASEALDSCAADLARVATQFPTVTRYYPRLQQARAHFMEALPVQHSLAVERVDDLTRVARATAEDVRATAHGLEQEGTLRYVVLGFAWIFILFTVGVAYFYKRERQQRPGQDTDQSAPR